MADIFANIGATAATAAAGAAAQLPRGYLPFGLPNVAAGDNATPASSTPVLAPFCGVATLVVGVAMPRAGYLTAFTVKLSVVGAGSALIAGIYKNGTLVAATALTILAAADEAAGTYDIGDLPYDAGDVIDVRIRTGSGWTAATSDAVILVEFTSLS